MGREEGKVWEELEDGEECDRKKYIKMSHRRTPSLGSVDLHGAVNTAVSASSLPCENTFLFAYFLFLMCFQQASSSFYEPVTFSMTVTQRSEDPREPEIT